MTDESAESEGPAYEAMITLPGGTQMWVQAGGDVSVGLSFGHDGEKRFSFGADIDDIGMMVNALLDGRIVARRIRDGS
jgi:hypothetical protein